MGKGSNLRNTAKILLDIVPQGAMIAIIFAYKAWRVRVSNKRFREDFKANCFQEMF